MNLVKSDGIEENIVMEHGKQVMLGHFIDIEAAERMLSGSG